MTNLIDDAQKYWSLDLAQRSVFQLTQLQKLTNHHISLCENYKKIVQLENSFISDKTSFESVPFLVADIFKELDLLSGSLSQIRKTLNSSGTTSELSKSRIYIDKETAYLQNRALINTLKTELGNSRLPVLIIDSIQFKGNRLASSARAAGIIGFSLMGTEVEYALTPSLEPDFKRITDFLEKHGKNNFLIFGFTYLVWNFLQAVSSKRELFFGINPPTLIHGGGWKKMESLGLNHNSFDKELRKVIPLTRAINYYGMVEQTGSIYLACEQGFFHTTPYNHITIRNFTNLSVLGRGKSGLIQSFSILPLSYPGHSVLTDDMGAILHMDDCPCGRPGIAFTVERRAAKSILRGCSDTL
jgi:Acyl-protein synthetase, LuxE